MYMYFSIWRLEPNLKYTTMATISKKFSPLLILIYVLSNVFKIMSLLLTLYAVKIKLMMQNYAGFLAPTLLVGLQMCLNFK